MADDRPLPDLRWRDYDFERNCLRIHGQDIPLTETQTNEILRLYCRAFARNGRAPKLGDSIFHI